MKLLLALVSSILLSSSISAQLILNVDVAQKQYFLSGSATGSPGGEPDFGYSVFWDNGRPYDGGYADLLSLSAFDVQGNSAFNLTMFFHGNGNVTARWILRPAMPSRCWEIPRSDSTTRRGHLL